MKKILLMAAFAVASLAANAQSYVGGTLGFSNSKLNSDNKTTTFKVAPEFGTALNDQMGIGIALGFTNSNTKSSGVESKTTTFRVNPYLRYQALEIGQVKVFVDGGVYFDYEKQKNYKAGIGFGLNVAPGISYNLSEKFSIVAKANDLFAFGYKKAGVPDVNPTPDARKTFNAELNSLNNFSAASLSFGFYYNF